MKSILFAAAAATILAAPAALGQAVTPIALTNGTQGPFFAAEDDSANASDAAWFIFDVDVTQQVNVDADRLSSQADLFGVLFAGDVTGDDATALSSDGLINGYTEVALDIGDTIGSLTVLDFQDDTDPNPFGTGAFGDPRFTLELDPGRYTVMITAFSPEPGGDFEIIASGVSAIPEPAGLGLLSAAGLGLVRRRR